MYSATSAYRCVRMCDNMLYPVYTQVICTVDTLISTTDTHPRWWSIQRWWYTRIWVCTDVHQGKHPKTTKITLFPLPNPLWKGAILGVLEGIWTSIWVCVNTHPEDVLVRMYMHVSACTHCWLVSYHLDTHIQCTSRVHNITHLGMLSSWGMIIPGMMLCYLSIVHCVYLMINHQISLSGTICTIQGCPNTHIWVIMDITPNDPFWVVMANTELVQSGKPVFS